MTSLAAVALALALQEKGVGYDDTPQLPDQKWKVHDSQLPVPPVVTPGDAPGKPPSDAVVLFDGKDLSKWHDGKSNDSVIRHVDDFDAEPRQHAREEQRLQEHRC